MNDFYDIKLIANSRGKHTTLLQVLSRQTILAPSLITQVIHDGGVYINQQRCQCADTPVPHGARIRLVILKHEQRIPFEPEQIVWQHDSFCLLHKHAGQYAQEALHRSAGTLPGELSDYMQQQHPASQQAYRPIHRLDRGTSGLILFCNKPKDLQHVQEHWHSSAIKRYLAVVSPAPAWDTQSIQAPLSSTVDKHGRYHVDANGRNAISHANVLKRDANRALLEMTLETGRTHQLRIHLSYLGYAILGDARYGGAPHHRMMLHAHELTLTPPALLQHMHWKAEPEKDWQW